MVVGDARRGGGGTPKDAAHGSRDEVSRMNESQCARLARPFSVEEGDERTVRGESGHEESSARAHEDAKVTRLLPIVASMSASATFGRAGVDA